MNSEEGMSMAKMAVTVLLVVLVIGAVVAIVYAAYSWFGSGTDKLADNVTSISDSAMSQYDDKVLSGSDVLSALKNFRNSDMCIMVSNLNNQKGTFQSDPDKADKTACYAYCALPSQLADKAGQETQLKYAAGPGSIGEQFLIDGFAYKDGSAIDIERNTNFSPTTTKGNANCFVKQNADWYANLLYDSTTGDVAGVVFRQMN